MLYLTILLGFLLRITNLNKPEGLWNDEYVSWFVSSCPFGEGFWQAVLKQCHMPLYYLYLKPFVHCSDVVLRLTSVIPEIFAIIIMYFVGREYSKKVGMFAALITSFLSFLVYYSQEVRFYSLLFLFSSLFLLYLIKYVKNSNPKNLICLVVSSLLILFTHILGVIFVFFTFIYIIYKKKKISLFTLSMLIIVLLFALYQIRVLDMLPSSQWWGNFSYTNILFLFSDYFSPILTNNVSAPKVFFYNKSLIVWQLFPTIIALLALIYGFRKGLGFITISTVSVLSVLALFGKLVFITKYTMEILPILILFLSIGFARLKKVGGILLLIFLSFHLFSIFTPYYPTKLNRSEGHKIVGDILKYQASQNVIFTYYEPNRFYRYFNPSNIKTYYISKTNRFEYLENPAKILKKIPIGESVSVVFLDSVSFIPDDYLYNLKDNSRFPEMFVTFSNVKSSILRGLDTNFKAFNVIKGGSWTVIRAVRYK